MFCSECSVKEDIGERTMGFRKKGKMKGVRICCSCRYLWKRGGIILNDRPLKPAIQKKLVSQTSGSSMRISVRKDSADGAVLCNMTLSSMYTLSKVLEKLYSSIPPLQRMSLDFIVQGKVVQEVEFDSITVPSLKGLLVIRKKAPKKVEPTSNGMVPADPSHPFYVIGLFDHVGKTKSHLTFEVGDLFVCLSHQEGPWWYGQLDSQDPELPPTKGWFPKTFVEPYDPLIHDASDTESESGSEHGQPMVIEATPAHHSDEEHVEEQAHATEPETERKAPEGKADPQDFNEMVSKYEQQIHERDQKISNLSADIVKLGKDSSEEVNEYKAKVLELESKLEELQNAPPAVEENLPPPVFEESLPPPSMEDVPDFEKENAMLKDRLAETQLKHIKEVKNFKKIIEYNDEEIDNLKMKLESKECEACTESKKKYEAELKKKDGEIAKLAKDIQAYKRELQNMRKSFEGMSKNVSPIKMGEVRPVKKVVSSSPVDLSNAVDIKNISLDEFALDKTLLVDEEDGNSVDKPVFSHKSGNAGRHHHTGFHHNVRKKPTPSKESKEDKEDSSDSDEDFTFKKKKADLGDAPVAPKIESHMNLRKKAIKKKKRKLKKKKKMKFD